MKVLPLSTLKIICDRYRQNRIFPTQIYMYYLQMKPSLLKETIAPEVNEQGIILLER